MQTKRLSGATYILADDGWFRRNPVIAGSYRHHDWRIEFTTTGRGVLSISSPVPISPEVGYGLAMAIFQQEGIRAIVGDDTGCQGGGILQYSVEFMEPPPARLCVGLRMAQPYGQLVYDFGRSWG